MKILSLYRYGVISSLFVVVDNRKQFYVMLEECAISLLPHQRDPAAFTTATAAVNNSSSRNFLLFY
jgi:hypothetical protein